MCPPSRVAFEKAKHLQRKDICMCQSGLIVKIKWAKNLNFFDKEFLIPITHIKNSPLCPVLAFTEMIKSIPASPSSPAFVYPCQGTLVTITHSDYSKFLSLLLQKSGYNSQLFSPHSLRRGSASLAFQAGVPPLLIQAHGIWKSDAYKEYLKFTMKTKLSVTQKMSQSILDLNITRY